MVECCNAKILQSCNVHPTDPKKCPIFEINLKRIGRGLNLLVAEAVLAEAKGCITIFSQIRINRSDIVTL